jgi:hypothetical protein
VAPQGAPPLPTHGSVNEASTSQKFWAEAKEAPTRSRMAEIDFILEYGEVKRIVLRLNPWGKARGNGIFVGRNNGGLQTG